MKHDPVTEADPTDASAPISNYAPVVLPQPRHDGWTAERQRSFLSALAETGCISEACRQAGITARSAYRLRAHRDGERFAQAWDRALRHATAKLLTLAYERAVVGAVREVWRDGKLIAESRAPSDRLLTFLLGNLAPWTAKPTTRWSGLDAMSSQAASDLPPLLDALADSDVPAEELSQIDFEAQPPVTAHDRPRAPFDQDDHWTYDA